MSRLKANFEKLDTAQRSLWPELAPAAEQGFVLYGGTALSLRFGHRGSFDFDFFSERSLDGHEMRKSMPFLNEAQTIQNDERNLTVIADRGGRTVKVSFFGSIGFGRVGTPELTEDGVGEVASPLDLAATKVKVVQQRAEAKDYRDILALVRSGLSLEDALAAARAIYGTSFQASESLKALTYFMDGDLPDLTDDERRELATIAAAVDRIPIVKKVSEHLGLNPPR